MTGRSGCSGQRGSAGFQTWGWVLLAGGRKKVGLLLETGRSQQQEMGEHVTKAGFRSRHLISQAGGVQGTLSSM